MQIRGLVLALSLVGPIGLLNAAPAHVGSKADMHPTGHVLVGDFDSFGMLFGRCVWIPPSPKAALAALSLFYGVGISNEADASGYETILAGQYVSGGKTEAEARQEVAALNACFGTYEVPPEHRSYRSGALG